ncbi:MAG: hypothetical protein OJF51_000640 [Nitrospira sp.]|jgi:hypothetical protein|nr:MAG: hypothetical protein OJF51_000640 [Nitrospira sp.]
MAVFGEVVVLPCRIRTDRLSFVDEGLPGGYEELTGWIATLRKRR